MSSHHQQVHASPLATDVTIRQVISGHQRSATWYAQHCCLDTGLDSDASLLPRLAGPLAALAPLTCLKRLDLNWLGGDSGPHVWHHPLVAGPLTQHQQRHQQVVAAGQHAGDLVAAVATAGVEGGGGVAGGHASVCEVRASVLGDAKEGPQGGPMPGLKDMVAGEWKPQHDLLAIHSSC
jgi:hypothetical protein